MLNARQKELHLLDNLANLFEKNVTANRMLLPFAEPSGWNKKTREGLAQLTERANGLVQALNDYFSGHSSSLTGKSPYDDELM